MSEPKDDPILMINDSPVRRLELAAMRAYRAKFPDGPTWLDLNIDTRKLWMDVTEQNTKHSAFKPANPIPSQDTP